MAAIWASYAFGVDSPELAAAMRRQSEAQPHRFGCFPRTRGRPYPGLARHIPVVLGRNDLFLPSLLARRTKGSPFCSSGRTCRIVSGPPTWLPTCLHAIQPEIKHRFDTEYLSILDPEQRCNQHASRNLKQRGQIEPAWRCTLTLVSLQGWSKTTMASTARCEAPLAVPQSPSPRESC